jgi:menaquinone-dependent protoporphyrinogen oxidase
VRVTITLSTVRLEEETRDALPLDLGAILATNLIAMRVLITWGSKRGGTAGIARMLAEALEQEGIDAVLRPADEAKDVSSFDAVIVGGALYANRWHRAARRFVRDHTKELRNMPAWFFSSGPLDESAESREIPPTRQVDALMARVGARGHATFGGRLSSDARGFIASKMARKHAGDWRDRSHIRAWAHTVARSISAFPAQRSHVAPVAPEQPRIVLATLCLLAGLTAIWGGIELVSRPDGSLVHLPLSLLEHSPFHDFLVPGLLLVALVGGISTLAGVLVLLRHHRANAEAMVSGAILVAWIVVEMLLIRHVHWLHGVYLTLGVAIGVVGASHEQQAGTLKDTTRAVVLVLSHAFVGWAMCGAIMAVLLAAAPLGIALFAHALAVPLVFAFVAASYFRQRSAWAPLRTAITFAVLVALFDLVIVACFIQHSLAMFQSFSGSWLPFLLIFVATWATGSLGGPRWSGHEASARP